MRLEGPPWDDQQRARELLAQSTSVLDLNTGGGEVLLSLQSAWPARVTVTEQHPPNLALARERLQTFGVHVRGFPLTLGDLMPLPTDGFDLVLNRHSAFNPDEVTRVISPGGAFLTQQVHGLWAEDLFEAFGSKPLWPFCTPDLYVPRLEATGMNVVSALQWQGTFSFLDVGALVYYLRAIPWVVPNFSVDTHLAQLLRLQQRLVADGELTFIDRSFLIEAYAP